MSSSDSALSVAVAALTSQSYNLSLISTNLANSSTVGYKEVEANFKTLITDSYATGSSKGTGSVTVSTVQLVDTQGVIETSDVATYMAIDGNGFFVVTGEAESDEFLYTRTGTFYPDEDGYLVNANGFYLQGWETDADGNLTGAAAKSSLEAINVNAISGNAEPTENIELVANLPAESDSVLTGATASDYTYTTSSEVYDALGTSHTLIYTWTKTDTNEWELSISDPTMTKDSSVTSGTTTGGPYTIEFTDGAISAIDGVATTEITFGITGYTTGSADSSITIDLSALQQFDSGEDDPEISVTSVDQDGLEFGELASVYIDDDGLVVAYFENGTSRPIYQIPLATFNDTNDLEAVSGNAYKETVESGNATLNVPGAGAAGTVSGYAVEDSTVSTAAELTEMIVAQQAYSAASQVISTTQDMFDSLISAAR